MTLTDEQLVEAWRDGRRIPVPYFDGQDAELFFEDEEEVREFADAIRAFLSIDPATRTDDVRHVDAYFRDVLDTVGPDFVDPGMRGMAAGSQDIWRFVTPSVIGAHESWELGDRDRRRTYVMVEGNCGWEDEHGILFSWRDGTDLVKVSAYDGHATNGHAYADLSKDAFVYHSSSPEHCTRR